MVKNELSKGIDIELGEEMAEGQYANMVVIAHSTSEFVLDFVRIMPGLPKAPAAYNIDVDDSGRIVGLF